MRTLTKTALAVLSVGTAFVALGPPDVLAVSLPGPWLERGVSVGTDAAGNVVATPRRPALDGPLGRLRDHVAGIADQPRAQPGSLDDLEQGLAAIVAGGIDGLAQQFDSIRDTARDAVASPTLQPPAQTAGPCPDPGCPDPGTAPAGSVVAALDVLQRDDARHELDAARWQQPVVGVAVQGDAATDHAMEMVDDVLAVMSEETGLEFHRSSDGPVTVDLSAGNEPRARVRVRGRTVLSAHAS